MKHNLGIILILVGLFLGAQVIGLLVTDKYLVKELPYKIQRPQLEPKTSFVPIFTIILIATLLAFVLMKFKAVKLWLFWFFLSVFLTMTISFSAFMKESFAIILALILAGIKIFKREVFTHNFTELFIYGGLAAIFVPILSLLSISILLILISIYDFIAVWKTQHMVKLAKYQITKLKIFAGLIIPYGKKRQAILGGGDIGFPLLFSGVILRDFGLIESLIVSLVTALALFGLLYFGRKNKFYPAMPYLSAGCFLGYLIVLLI